MKKIIIHSITTAIFSTIIYVFLSDLRIHSLWFFIVSVTSVIYMHQTKKKRGHNLFMHPPFGITLIIGVTSVAIITILIWWNDLRPLATDYTHEGFSYTLGILKPPGIIAAAFLAALGLIASQFRSEQTYQQILISNDALKTSEGKIKHDKYMKIKKETQETFDKNKVFYLSTSTNLDAEKIISDLFENFPNDPSRYGNLVTAIRDIENNLKSLYTSLSSNLEYNDFINKNKAISRELRPTAENIKKILRAKEYKENINTYINIHPTSTLTGGIYSIISIVDIAIEETWPVKDFWRIHRAVKLITTTDAIYCQLETMGQKEVYDMGWNTIRPQLKAQIEDFFKYKYSVKWDHELITRTPDNNI